MKLSNSCFKSFRIKSFIIKYSSSKFDWWKTYEQNRLLKHATPHGTWTYYIRLFLLTLKPLKVYKREEFFFFFFLFSVLSILNTIFIIKLIQGFCNQVINLYCPKTAFNEQGWHYPRSQWGKRALIILYIGNTDKSRSWELK